MSWGMASWWRAGRDAAKERGVQMGFNGETGSGH